MTPNPRKRCAAAVPGTAAVFFCGAAAAGAWPTPPGETLAILKYERQTADRAFGPDGERVALPARRDESLSLFVEHGLTRRLTGVSPSWRPPSAPA